MSIIEVVDMELVEVDDVVETSSFANVLLETAGVSARYDVSIC